MLLNCVVGGDSWESLGQKDQTSQSSRKSTLNIHWKDWCWSWNSNTLATWCEELAHFKRPWCWEGLGTGGKWDDKGWDGWMASPTWWTWVWVSSGSWWWTGRPGVLWFTASQRVGHDWATEMNWTNWACQISQIMGLELRVHIKKEIVPICKWIKHKSIKNLNVKGKTIGLIILMTKGFLKQDTAHITHKGKDW